MVDVDLTLLNKSELVQLCNWVNIYKVHRGMPRELLYELIENWRANPQSGTDNPVNHLREKLQEYFYTNWATIYSQIPCHTFCWLHTDAKVMSCFLENEQALKAL